MMVGLMSMISLVSAGFTDYKIIPVSEDTFVANSSATKNFGGALDLYVGSSNVTIKRTYLKWDISDLTELNISQARIYLYGDAFDMSNVDVDLHSVTNDIWRESGANNITWNNKPPFSQPPLDTQRITIDQTWYGFNVTANIKGSLGASDFTASYLLKGKDETINNFENFIRFRPKEYTTSDVRPYLNVSFWNSSDPFVNTPPVIDSVSAPTSGSEGNKVDLSFSAHDDQDNIQAFSILLDGKLLSHTESFQWIPHYEDAGTRTLTFTVNDTRGALDSEARTITIMNVQNLTINELYPNNRVGEDQWVEIYNPFNVPFTIENWRVEDFAHAGATIPAITIPPLGYLQVLAPSLGFSLSGDIISLYDDRGILVDRVSYGSASQSDPNNAPAPPQGNSTGRKTDGVDTDVEKNDFMIFTVPSPQLPNSGGGCNQTGADSNCNGCVETLELFGFISHWKIGDVSTLDLFSAIGLWKSGEGCS